MAPAMSASCLMQAAVSSCFQQAAQVSCQVEERLSRITCSYLRPADLRKASLGACHAESTLRCWTLEKASLRGSAGYLVQAVATGEEVPLDLDVDGRREIDKSETLAEDPYGTVESAMCSQVVTTTPEATLDTILEQFEHYTGLPVVDGQGHCVGIISNIDVARYARGKVFSLPTTKVKDVMTSPAFVILKGAPIAYAAGLMLQHKIHRLPVVDSKGVVVGIVTRTDLFEPLAPQINGIYHMLLGHNVERLSDTL